MGFGVPQEEKYWAVTCKRCREIINFALIEDCGRTYKGHGVVVAIECPVCKEKRKYHGNTEVWRHRVTAGHTYPIIPPLFVWSNYQGEE